MWTNFWLNLIELTHFRHKLESDDNSRTLLYSRFISKFGYSENKKWKKGWGYRKQSDHRTDGWNQAKSDSQIFVDADVNQAMIVVTVDCPNGCMSNPPDGLTYVSITKSISLYVYSNPSNQTPGFHWTMFKFAFNEPRSSLFC